MAERLARVLEKLAEKGKLHSTLDDLESAADRCTTQSTESSSQHFQSVSQLVEHYQWKQAQDRKPKSQSRVARQNKVLLKSQPSKTFSLNFAKYRRAGRFSYKMVPPGKVQVPGFCNTDSHHDVITKGAKGLGIQSNPDRLSLIVSNGLVRDAPLHNDKPWTLGNYTNEFGGVQARGKRTFGIYMPIDVEEEEEGGGKSDDEQYIYPERKAASSQKRGITCLNVSDAPIVPKKQKSSLPAVVQGTLREDPIDLDDDEDEPLEIEFQDSNSYGIYCPMTAAMVFPSITASGREGVWRLLHLEYRALQQEVVKEMEDDVCNLQPESEGFILVELQSGGTTYLKAQVHSRTEVKMKDLKFFVKEERLVHSKTTLQLNKSPTALLVISPNHGRVEYQWEWKRVYMQEWEIIDVPSWTCLLYVDTPGQYRCTVDGSKVLFRVQAPRRCQQKITKNQDELSVEYDDIQFGEVLGRGSAGTVYKGKWREMTVALKRIKIPPGVEKSQVLANNREVATLRLLKHPNIVSLLGHAVSPEGIVLIMNFIPGKNLDELIFGKEKIISKATEEQRATIAKSVAGGVEFMHSRDPVIIHQDLKPLNIMVTDDLQGVYICDMGIAKLKQAAQATMTTVTKGPTGTFPYMAPEMFHAGHRGTAVDIYALGCLYIELFGHKCQ